MKYPACLRKKVYEELMRQFQTQMDMARFFGVSFPAVTRWKKAGVPNALVPYLKLKYPKLQAWEEFKGVA